MLEVSIRPEAESDAGVIQEITERAFGRPYEALVVERVRQSSGFIPELSLVAEREKQIVGHVMLSELEIEGESKSWTVLALGPVSVRPEFQKQGIGGQTIRAGLARHRVGSWRGRTHRASHLLSAIRFCACRRLRPEVRDSGS